METIFPTHLFVYVKPKYYIIFWSEELRQLPKKPWDLSALCFATGNVLQCICFQTVLHMEWPNGAFQKISMPREYLVLIKSGDLI